VYIKKSFFFAAIAVLVLTPVSYASATLKISAVYSETANTFDILDQVSMWWDGFCEDDYQKYWKEKYGLTEEDLHLFERYKEFRKKYYDFTDQSDSDPLKGRNGFFATLGILTEDPIAIAFYSSGSLADAYKKVSSIASSEELEFLKTFHSHYKQKLMPLLEESKKFTDALPKLNAAIKKPGIAKLFEQAEHFYNVKGDIDYRVLLIWWPPVKHTLATPVGNFLIFRYNPVKHLNTLKSDADIVFHEIVHTISARQSLDQKQSITKKFFSKCEIQGKLKKKQYLEEPLAVAIGQLLYLQKFEPAKLDFSAHIYNDTWIGPFGKLIFPLVQQYFQTGKNITDGFAEAAGSLCQEQVLMAQKLFTPIKD
jgi:hypothetical protein